MNIKSRITKLALIGALFFVSASLLASAPRAKAADDTDFAPGLTVSPMTESVVLNPGDKYSSSIRVTYPADAGNSTHYKVKIEPFYVDENYNNVYGERNNYNLITDWVSFDSPEMAEVKPGETKEIYYTFHIPTDAPAGGQYLAISVVSDDSENQIQTDAINISESFSVSHLIFAEITGATVRQGEIYDVDVPGFLLSGDIKGRATVKNTGNVHNNATYTLQVFPLFSNEEMYTNEDKPDTKRIMPDRSYYNETVWDKTPAFGIFNVVYTVEFEGVTAQVKKLVIKCPIWLLFLIIFAIAAIIIYFIVKAKTRKSRKNSPATTTE